jgi:hypothetical protein
LRLDKEGWLRPDKESKIKKVLLASPFAPFCYARQTSISKTSISISKYLWCLKEHQEGAKGLAKKVLLLVLICLACFLCAVVFLSMLAYLDKQA